jgi:anti-sigma factor RsiW
VADELHDDHLGDDVVALVLGTVDGDRRAHMAAHVLACPVCRQEYDELSATVEDLLPAVPGVQPPLGFEERVLGRIGSAARAAAPPPARRSRWPWLVAAAAAVLLALAVPLGLWARDDGSVTAGAVAPLRTEDGTAVGTVAVSHLDGAPVMVVAFVAAPDGIAYHCRIRFADGTTLDTPAWQGNGAWVVPLADDTPGISSVDVMPDGTDRVWSRASF